MQTVNYLQKMKCRVEKNRYVIDDFCNALTSSGSARSLVMIGDCNPHGPNYPLNRDVKTQSFTAIFFSFIISIFLLNLASPKMLYTFVIIFKIIIAIKFVKKVQNYSLLLA